ncbi:MAG: hypothetical protein OEM06_11665, partial [Desulfobacteraceae bacterium]|nr:hypothetical protein [Desulfobacteraceae bacterium]MDH3573954.1 hypothetical protein [Desulfobacteraceae bacterium]MDH3722212.1 hypothetical protein [Desulfobacteraceae bacterium]MDH3836386.1 hypothetical protein [Desulfobacteraceae bacterium]MDH3875573.1 hypothetical protein [Desulfobacteraceae bacterium]
MTDKVLEEITVGLSDAEKDDLEEMIKAFRKKQSAAPETPASEDEQKQILSIGENLAQYGDILLKLDTKLKLLYGILRLSDQKNRIMNQRIDAVIEVLKGQQILTEE